jgi:hypothetical protein
MEEGVNMLVNGLLQQCPPGSDWEVQGWVVGVVFRRKRRWPGKPERAVRVGTTQAQDTKAEDMAAAVLPVVELRSKTPS